MISWLYSYGAPFVRKSLSRRTVVMALVSFRMIWAIIGKNLKKVQRRVQETTGHWAAPLDPAGLVLFADDCGQHAIEVPSADRFGHVLVTATGKAAGLFSDHGVGCQ